MKKIFSLILAILMIASSFAAIAVSAESGEAGNWEMHLDAFNEAKLDSGSEMYVSTPGYEYTNDGFEVVPPVYSGVEAKYTVISNEKYSTKDFSIKIRIDEFDLTGDAWLSFTFWSEKNGLVQGSSTSEYGYGWTSLIKDCVDKGVSDGKLSHFEAYSQGSKTQPGGFQKISTMDFATDSAEDKQIIEFKVQNSYVYVNGTQLDNTAAGSLRTMFRSDNYLAHFGISVKSGISNSPIKFTILEVNGEKPQGSDKLSPVNRGKEYGEMKDPATIPAGTPGVLFDGSLDAQNGKLPSTSGASASANTDNSVRINASMSIGSVMFNVNDDYTVDINDFPYIAIVLKNFCTCGREDGLTVGENCYFREENTVYYCAGNVISPDENHKIAIDGEFMVDISPEGSEDYYLLVYAKVDTSEYEDTDARIHSLRFNFTNMDPSNDIASFDIEYAGFFRSVADMVSFATSEGFNLIDDEISYEDPELPTDDPTDDPTEETTTEEPTTEEPTTEEPTTEEPTTAEPTEEPTTEEPTEEPTEAPTTEPATTEAPTEAPSKAPTEESTTEPTVAKKRTGCGSTVGMSVVAILVTSVSAGFVAFKKKKKN